MCIVIKNYASTGRDFWPKCFDRFLFRRGIVQVDGQIGNSFNVYLGNRTRQFALHKMRIWELREVPLGELQNVEIQHIVIFNRILRFILGQFIQGNARECVKQIKLLTLFCEFEKITDCQRK